MKDGEITEFKFDVAGISHVLLLKYMTDMLIEWGQEVQHYAELRHW